MKKIFFLVFALSTFLFAGCESEDGFDKVVNPDNIYGTWSLSETLILDPTQRECTITFEKSGCALKRYSYSEETEIYSFVFVDNALVCLEANGKKYMYRLETLNDNVLRWVTYPNNNACKAQTFKRSKNIPINDVIAPEGCVNGEFAVGEDSVGNKIKIYFSKGNLTYLPSENRFRLHDNQYGMCAMINNVYTVDKCLTWDSWIDLFFWGTSGWNGGVYDYRPGTRNNENSYFYINNDMSQDMSGDYAKADWGVYNKIENGGNQDGLWRVLSADEVKYLFGKREGLGKLYAFGYVDKVNGIFIFPDNFICPSNIPVKTYKEAESTNPNNNRLSLTDFALLEQLGVVFLPGCGRANYLAGTMTSTKPAWYWTSTTGVNTKEYVQNFYFDDEKVGIAETVRNMGHSVRLVQEVK